MIVSENIRKYRKQAQLTQRQLAEKIDKKEVTIRRYEKGDIVPPLPVIKDIATALNTSISDIIGDDDNLNWEAIKEGYTEDIDSYYRRPSDLKLRNDFKNVSDTIDNFLSNEYIEKEFNYKYDNLSTDEQIEFSSFIHNIIDLKIKEINARRDFNDK